MQKQSLTSCWVNGKQLKDNRTCKESNENIKRYEVSRSEKNNSGFLNRMKANKWQNKVFGFCRNDFESWNSFVRLMCRPEDSSSLAAFRIAFGLLMIFDIGHERGFAYIDYVYGKRGDICRFALFDFIKPLSILHMSIVYILMLLGAFGICIGCFYRLACITFSSAYWYIYLLDKTRWNNHSYLYGLIGLMMCTFDADNFCSVYSFCVVSARFIDRSVSSIWDTKKRNKHIPLWHYFVLRTQIFLVYFIAGLKKTEYDWLAGYSFSTIGEHWVLSPFRLFLPTKLVTWLVVHGSGFIIDTFVGFFLFFDKTRIFGTIIVSSFHLMNSQIFAIGVFPWVMLASTAIFYANDWPKNVIRRIKNCAGFKPIHDDGSNNEIHASGRCVYSKSDIDRDETRTQIPIDSLDLKETPMHPRTCHKMATTMSLLFISSQIFLPYSHFITKGYNGWTQGLYGYSWDMMIHSWQTQHIRITAIDKRSNTKIYLNPDAFTSSRRWSSHPDMIKQHAMCIAKYLRKRNKHWNRNIAIKMDIWRSLNGRFIQRQIDPNIDLVSAEWSPFKQTDWLIPLLDGLSNWRNVIRELEETFHANNDFTELTFVSDLHGLKSKNFVDAHMNTLLFVLDGEVKIDLLNSEPKHYNQTTFKLKAGQHVSLPSNQYYKIKTISIDPSCIVYIHRNETEKALMDVYKIYHKLAIRKLNKTMHGSLTIRKDSHLTPDEDINLDIGPPIARKLENIWQMKIYKHLARIPPGKIIKDPDMRHFVANITAFYPNIIQDYVLEALNQSLSFPTNKSFDQKLISVLNAIKTFIYNKGCQYRRAVFVIIFTLQCMTSDKKLDDMLLEKYDLVYT